MYGVFSTHGYLLGSFERREDAERALKTWNQASVIVWIGDSWE
jgi:hypothetical protein